MKHLGPIIFIASLTTFPLLANDTVKTATDDSIDMQTEDCDTLDPQKKAQAIPSEQGDINPPKEANDSKRDDTE